MRLFFDKLITFQLTQSKFASQLKLKVLAELLRWLRIGKLAKFFVIVRVSVVDFQMPGGHLIESLEVVAN